MLQKTIAYQFSDEHLLTRALTHRSVSAKKNNERLEFLGDAILGQVIATALFDKFPDAREGQLTRLRASMVKGTTLAEIARGFKLGDYLHLGSGELKSGGFRRDSILADAVEAIIGAVFLDAGFDVCRDRVLSWYSSRLDELSLGDVSKDSKSTLQEYLQGRKEVLPEYSLLSATGEEHAQWFTVECMILSGTCFVGEGRSRRIAEQQAAKDALSWLKEHE